MKIYSSNMLMTVTSTQAFEYIWFPYIAKCWPFWDTKLSTVWILQKERQVCFVSEFIKQGFLARASRFHIWLTAAKTQKTRRVVSSAGRVILKIGVTDWRWKTKLEYNVHAIYTDACAKKESYNHYRWSVTLKVQCLFHRPVYRRLSIKDWNWKLS